MGSQSTGPEVSRERVNATAADLIRSGSIELSAHRPGDATAIAEVLPAATPVLVNHLPRHALEDTLGALRAIAAAGLTPVPHLAARRFASRGEAAGFLKRAVDESDIARVLVVAGEAPLPEGPFGDGTAFLDSGVLTEAGIREVILPVYPEGHPSIASDRLTDALRSKIAIARRQGLGVSLLSQFSFAPHRIVEHCATLARQYSDIPVVVGIAGPTSPVRLIEYARRCGVSASLRALQAQGLKAVGQLLHTDPREQLLLLAQHVVRGGLDNVLGVHVFSFGGVRATATWMNDQLRRTEKA
jgi:methylenetetrahydrofolate reductase (NADPH)